jgi:hypothetical protein
MQRELSKSDKPTKTESMEAPNIKGRNGCKTGAAQEASSRRGQYTMPEDIIPLFSFSVGFTTQISRYNTEIELGT